ncbi:MAG: SurA N-terminal domain-containing protein [Verrucomicrobia bacterium]|nr:SurA N-terminal domain-containing protein [Verrucomicrobiota bacterium]
MKLKLIPFLLLLPLLAIANEPQGELVVQNRILATVNGKNITVMDVMKKMDVYLARAYPEYAKSNTHRYQFFSQNWKRTLNQMIDNELIVADAERLEMKITDADIREIIHERFGPNVIATLDELGVTYDEARTMIHHEIASQRMTWYRVHSKAMHKVGPQSIKNAFEEHIVNNPPKEEWKYQVISIRGKTEQLGNIYAQKAIAVIKNEPLPFEELAKLLKEQSSEDENISVTVSDEYCVEGKALSDSHKAVICSLTPGTYSEPTLQVSRDKSAVHRIFYLKEHSVSPPPKFDAAMIDNLQDDLIQKQIEVEYPQYMAKLRKQFNFDEKSLEAIPTDFQPFSLL